MSGENAKSAFVVDLHKRYNMSKLVLRLSDDVVVKGVTTATGLQVFSVHDVIALCLGVPAKRAVELWNQMMCWLSRAKICTVDPYDLEALVVMAPILRNKAICTTPATTLAGLHLLVQVLAGLRTWDAVQVDADVRRMVEDAFTRFSDGDASMIEVCVVEQAPEKMPRHETNDVLMSRDVKMSRDRKRTAAKRVVRKFMKALAEQALTRSITAVELKEFIMAKIVELNKLHHGKYIVPSELDIVVERLVAGDECLQEKVRSLFMRVPRWPKNKDELVVDVNDTWYSFFCAHKPRKTTRRKWLRARAQVRSGIFEPIVRAAESALSANSSPH